uniref:Ribosomal protein S3 n=1 Tax=Renouxia sp. TaxID=2485823 RepID=A0A3G3MIK3_9FLOR|nr:ribosomal protein S3 [Renouxia sp.]
MAQKINPLSFRLGALQLWTDTLQKYGKIFTPYVLINYQKKQINNVFIHYLRSKELILDDTKVIIINHRVTVNIVCLELKKNSLTERKKLILAEELRKILSQWFNSLVFINFYFKKNWLSSAALTSNYIIILIDRKINTFKKTLQDNFRVLKNCVGIKKVVYYRKGVATLILKGVKIYLSGCFDISRTQMSKTIKYNFGLLSLTKVNSYIEYSYKEIFTKYGVCSLRVWFFYEIE